VLAETSNYGTKHNRYVTTALQTTNNEWEMTVGYAGDHAAWKPWVIASVALLSFCIASLVYIVLMQKQIHTAILGQTMAQEGKVEVERNMTAYFAHELRNPLGAIDSALCALPDDLPDSTKEIVRGMQLCTAFMSTIMNNLLDFRKMEEGKMLLHPQPVSLNELLMNVHRMLLSTVKPGVDLVVDRKTPVGQDWVLGDLHRLQQVLTNITTNAIKYTVSGSITLSFKIEHGHVRFECTDTGPGIPKHEQDKVFEQYVQRGGAPGTGLGLAISKHIVTLMGGSIQFDSDPTQSPGTTCIVVVPLPSCHPIECESSKPTVTVEPIANSLLVLIVDDSGINRQMLSRRIKRHILPNAEITEASTGEEALKLCEKETFDLVIMDQYMEEAGGVLLGSDTVNAMRRMKKDSIIIGCSGNEMNASFMAAGTDWVWLKPVPSNATIVQQIRAALEKKEDR
jgi:signal transduction histidine kinase/ActR/RegA family two-component response regulator